MCQHGPLQQHSVGEYTNGKQPKLNMVNPREYPVSLVYMHVLECGEIAVHCMSVCMH